MSLHAIGVNLGAYLLSQGCPLPVVDGPELPTTTWGRERVVIEHDAGGESFGPPRGLHINAKHRRTRSAAYKITIYARSAAAGAGDFEHRTRAENVLECVIVGLDNVAAARINRWEPKSGGFITPVDLVKSETQAGAVYELKLTYDLPIRVVTFPGAARPEGTLVDFISSTGVYGPPPDTSAEIACGA